MHEMSLANDIVDIVVATAKEYGAEKVFEVHMTIGKGRDIVDDLFEGLFDRLCVGTIAEGAKLIFVRVPLMVRCNECKTIYALDVFNNATWPCPHCKQKNYALYSGMEFTVDKVVVDCASNEA